MKKQKTAIGYYANRDGAGNPSAIEDCKNRLIARLKRLSRGGVGNHIPSFILVDSDNEKRFIFAGGCWISTND